MNPMRTFLLSLALLLGGCGGGGSPFSRPDWQPPAGATPSSGTYVYLESESTDYIGQGRTSTFTQTNATILMSTTGARVRISVSGAENWTGEFLASDSLDQVAIGFWGDLPLYPPANPADGGISWSGEGRSCTTATGWFVIDRLEFRAGQVSAIELRFEQRCNGGTSVLHGKIRIEL
jgi:hypothetical protein